MQNEYANMNENNLYDCPDAVAKLCKRMYFSRHF